jgi:hypothetical protein
MRTIVIVALLLLVGIPAVAQETRSTISGTVRDEQGVIPGAAVRVTNVGTGVSQQLTTNSSGYFEARLLNAGSYEVTVEMTGFKTLRRTGITLASGQQLSLQFLLELGTLAETITVTGEAPLLETTTLRQGLVLDERKIAELPVQSNMPVLLARFAPGMFANGQIPYAGQGFVGGPTNNARPLGNVGGNEWTIDGATNGGVGRMMATSPNTDMIQEMRVESTNFTASIGHGTGVGVSMMTRAGTNTSRGTVNHQYWTNKFNAPNRFQKAIFDRDPRTKEAYEDGLSHNLSLTYGGPIQIPNVVDGRNKLFMFLNYSMGRDDFPGKAANANRTIPRNDPGHNHRAGDFSDLLLLPNPAQYQIYDPLTTRPDPNRPGHVIRDPFPNNIIPADRIVNPLYNLYTGFLPNPNQNPTAANQQPINNYYDAAQPEPLRSHVWGARVDYNHSERNRFFGRAAGSWFTEGFGDWTYESAPGLHVANRFRKTWTYTGTWTRVAGETVFDGQLSANRFTEHDRWFGLREYTPSSVGLPSYMDEFCQTRGEFGGVSSCGLPRVQIAGYQSFADGTGGGSGYLDQGTNYQGQLTMTQVRGSHTVRAGADFRRHERVRDFPGRASGNFIFNNEYTRKADDTTLSPAANLGLSWAAFMLGMPSAIEQDMNARSIVTSPYLGTFFEDTWRVSDNVTLNFGLRYEYEDGIRERSDQMLVGFDPNAAVSIAPLAEAAYAANPIPQLPASAFDVTGGSVYASDPGQTGLSWPGQSMWMPRVSGSWSLNERTVLKAGYGMYYDTLNGTTFSVNQTGYSARTSSVPSVDFGQTWILGDPENGVSPVVNPFPIRPDGTRLDQALGSALGADTLIGREFEAQNPNREHARVQRWRASVQREISRNMAVEIAYNGSRGDHLDRTIRQDYLPEEWYSDSNVRDIAQQNLLNGNVTNPFFIGNFEALRTSNPALYNQMTGNSFFTSRTIQRHRLLRDFPHMSSGDGLEYANLPVGENRAHSLELSLTRRFANGFMGSVSYTATTLRENRTLEEYDRQPTIWQTSQFARPHRLAADFIVEFPFGASKPFLSEGGVLAAIVGGWQIGGTYEYQPGQLLEWSGNAIGSVNNIFFYGDLDDIAIDNPTIDRWFNVDAGFERNPAKTPANYQKRAFPFRIDGVRAPSLMHLNMNVARTIRFAGNRSLQLRVDALNILNNETYANPNLNPTSTQFGRITANNGTYMRFVTFVTKLTF